MLNRRYLRIKVFQHLYSYYITPGSEVNRSEIELFRSLEKIYDLYLSLLLLLVELNKFANQYVEKSKTRMLAREEEQHLHSRFAENKVIQILVRSNRLKRLSEKKDILWKKEEQVPLKIFKTIIHSPEFLTYIGKKEVNFENDKDFITETYKNYIFNSEELHAFFEEKNIHWEDDITLANLSVVKTLEQIQGEANPDSDILLPLYKDEAEDTVFVRDLLRKTIRHDEEFKGMISGKAANWELERIAVADMILMKMALCELVELDNIPVKVSLNEYIEISKDYSTPQSKIFINGILDKLVIELKSSGKIIKKGRGLLE